jgi:hypothetical protein
MFNTDIVKITKKINSIKVAIKIVRIKIIFKLLYSYNNRVTVFVSSIFKE